MNRALALALLFVSTAARADETPAPPAVGFREAVERAIARNPSARQAAEEIRRAEGLMQQVRAAALPSLTGRATYTRLDNDRVLASTGAVVLPADAVNLNLLLTVPVVDTRAWLDWRRGRMGVDVARASAAEVRRQVALATARAYLGVVTQQRLVQIHEHARTAARAHHELTKVRLDGGVGTRIDLARAAEEVAAVEAGYESVRLELTRAREALGILTGADGPLDAAELTLPDTLPTPAEAVGAVARRPDVALFQRRLQLSEQRYRDRWADFMPSIVGTFQPSYQNPPTLTLPSLAWQATIGLTLPIYDGGLRYGRWREAAATAALARLDVEDALRRANSEVRTAFAAVTRSDEAAARAAEAARFADEALTLAEMKYRAGASSNLEVIDAERRARDAHTRAAIAEDAARQARVDLLAATARFP